MARVIKIALAGVVCILAMGIVLASLAPQRAKPRNILMVVVDSLPAERLGCYGYSRVVNGVKTSMTPNIDSLVEKGTLFENCISQSNWTPTSMASMLYSANPTARSFSHSFDYLSTLGADHCLFSEMSKSFIEYDYDRYCVQTNPYLMGSTFTSMFDFLANVVPRPFRTSDYRLMGKDVIHGDAGAVNKQAYSVISGAKKKDRGFVLYLHYMDVHEPYPWHPAFCQALGIAGKGPENFGDLRNDCCVAYMKGGSTGQYAPDFAKRIERLSSDYDQSLAYLDNRLGELFKYLEDQRLMEDTFLIFCADHGQQFGQHGNIGHCLDMHHEETHVPLVFVGGGMPAGVRVPTQVRNLDIIPTIEEFVGLHPKSDGEELLSVAKAAEALSPAPDREVFSCSDYPSDINPDKMMKMIVSPSRLKYIATEDKTGKVVKEELFDLLKDGDERTNLASATPDEIAAMRARLAEIYSQAPSRPAPSTASAPAKGPKSPVIRERLRSVGYLH